MSSVSVSCPKCGRVLKLADRSLLGRRGKCPKCEHRFVLAEPSASADPAAAEPRAKDPQSTARRAPQSAAVASARRPLPGTSARWIPDEPAAEDAASLPVLPLAGSPVPQPAQNAAPTSPPSAADDPFSAFDFTSAATEGPGGAAPIVNAEPAPLRSVRRRRRSGLMIQVIMAVCTAVIAGIIIGVRMLNHDPVMESARRPPAAENRQWRDQETALASSNDDAVSYSPTQGEPIPLNFIPFTPQLICHLHPAELWQRERSVAEFQAMLGDLSLWLKSAITRITHFEPEEIDELTFAVNFGPRASEPEVAAVVRLREEQTESELFRRFDGQVRPDLEGIIYESGPLCFLLIDRKTFAVAPTDAVDALSAAKDYPALPPADLEPLLKASDRTRHLTLLFDVPNIDIHREDVLREELQPLSDAFVVWMGKDIETVSWSLHLEPNLYMETLLRQSNESSALKVQRQFRLQLDRLPERILKLAELMRPATEGSRRMVGRFPAMLQAVALATSVDTAGQYVRCVTLLPRNAAANLAAGSLLTWNESVVTDFSTAVAASGSGDAGLPDTVAERLNLPVLVDFRATPLQEVVAYISEEIKTEFVINGDGLKMAAFTQNMPQTFDLGTVSAKAALHAVLQQYAAERDPMVICVDEAGKRITLTTKSAAVAAGTPVFDTSP